MRMRLKMGATGEQRSDKFLSFLLFMYCALLPMEEALASSFGSILRLVGVAVMGYCVIAFLRQKIKLKELQLLLPFLVWILYSFLTVIWCEEYSWWIYFFQIYAFQILFVLVVLSYQRFVDLNYIKNGLITGATLAAGILIFFPAESMLTDDGRRTIIMFGNEFDPNILAGIIMVALVVLADRAFNKRSSKMFFLAIFLSVGLLYTGSRGALISTVAGLGYYFLQHMRNRGTRQRSLLLVVIGIAIAVTVLLILPEELFLSRFTLDSLLGLEDYRRGGHNRWTIWKYALPLVEGAPILGYGCGNFFEVIETVYRQCASHNLYILLLIENGIIGLFIFAVGLFRMLNAARREKDYLAMTLLVSICIMSLTIDSITCKFFWVGMILAIASITKHKEEVLQ